MKSFGQQSRQVLEDFGHDGMTLLKDGAEKSAAAIADEQFRVFAIEEDEKGLRLVDPHEVVPKLAGASDKPDVRMNIELVAFHAPASLRNGEFKGATLRLDVGQDPLSRSVLSPVFWSIAAALDLKSALDTDRRGAEQRPSAFRHDFTGALQNRAIEIPGGLAEIRFELVAHKPDPWWNDIFSFAKSPAGKALVSAIGFPTIVPEAINIIDEALNSFIKKRDVLFASQPLRFAANGVAKADFTGGLNSVLLASLNPGFLVMTRQKDFARFAASRAKFLGGHGLLIPADVSVEDYLKGGVDPFDDVPYAVLRVRAEEASFKHLS